MKTPNGKYITISTQGWQEAFDEIAPNLEGEQTQTLMSFMRPMITKLDIPGEEYNVVVSYLHTWVIEQLTRRGFHVVRGQMGGIFRDSNA
jgi:hypothetical protein